MGDKSPKKDNAKKPAKSLKEKRAPTSNRSATRSGRASAAEQRPAHTAARERRAPWLEPGHSTLATDSLTSSDSRSASS